jgi:hypothetical protein
MVLLFILVATVIMLATIFLNFKMQYSRLLANIDAEYHQLRELFEKRNALLHSMMDLLVEQAVGAKEREYVSQCSALLERATHCNADNYDDLRENAQLHQAVDALRASAFWAQWENADKKQLVFVQEDIAAKAASYNLAVRTYNTMCHFFPANLVAKRLGLKPRTEYTITLA